jgi:hypothetical protein
VLIDAVDSLYDTSRIGDHPWARLASVSDGAVLLDLLMLSGWYHAVSFAAIGVEVDLEDGAPRFTDVG